MRGCGPCEGFERPGHRKSLNPFIEPEFLAGRAEKMESQHQIVGRVPVRVIKRQFGFTDVHYRGLAKNTVQIVTRFALSNLRTARRKMMQAKG